MYSDQKKFKIHHQYKIILEFIPEKVLNKKKLRICRNLKVTYGHIGFIQQEVKKGRWKKNGMFQSTKF
ncbi:hypothetical protein BpHYR1_024157 [Brachionus plicatilis]|uniref:Uncharacterized protein n=1 Tax=Brachionus plicatilis TaxID=10195 RepID=A0A3M7S860_BRAPC|nr:hypothetical protein BpHYR1_024157 [Brachionus plicatilis]